MANAKLTKAQKREIADRFVAGEEGQKLADEFGVCKNTVVRACRDLHAVRPKLKPAKAVDMAEFASQARSTLWRQDEGCKSDAERKTFLSWKARVESLMSKDGAGYKKNEAIVSASKEYPCLLPLFRKFNVSEYDPTPESHPRIQHGKQPVEAVVHCEGLDQTHRENLRWAQSAAGTFARTGERPTVCPCDRAWYLYEQAVSDPKDFLSRVGQMESKGDTESAERKSARLAGKRSIAEIDGMLAELEHEGEDEDEETA